MVSPDVFLYIGAFYACTIVGLLFKILRQQFGTHVWTHVYGWTHTWTHGRTN